MSTKTRITHEMIEAVNAARRFGESKHEAKEALRTSNQKTGEDKKLKGVFSYGTDATYKKQGKTFINWVLNAHPNVRCLADTRAYVEEYINENIQRGLSASTIHTRVYALACVFDCEADDFAVELPKRSSLAAKRNRNAPPIEDFRKETQYIHRFAVATGARRCGLKRLTDDCLKVDEHGRLLIFLDEKGGKTRWARVLKDEQDFVISVIEAAKQANALRSDGCRKVFPDKIIPEREPLHQHRRDYAKRLYAEVIQDGEHLIADRGLYRCRGKRYGEVYNRTALAIVSYNLGHGQPDDLPHEVERVGVVVSHYFW